MTLFLKNKFVSVEYRFDHKTIIINYLCDKIKAFFGFIGKMDNLKINEDLNLQLKVFGDNISNINS